MFRYNRHNITDDLSAAGRVFETGTKFMSDRIDRLVSVPRYSFYGPGHLSPANPTQ
jgi:hypothetical protein